jgi:hypothetical protein
MKTITATLIVVLVGLAAVADRMGWAVAAQAPVFDGRVVVKAGTRELVAPRVRVALGATTMLKIAIKNGQLALE